MRLRAMSAITLVAASCLLPAGIGAAMGQHSQTRAALDAGLEHAAAEEAGILSDYFQNARSLTLLAAHDPGFAQFYATTGSRTEKILRGGPLMRTISDGLAYLETLFPGSVGEACFIDRSGAEVARSVRGANASLPTCRRTSRTTRSSRPRSPCRSAPSTRPARTCHRTPANG